MAATKMRGISRGLQNGTMPGSPPLGRVSNELFDAGYRLAEGGAILERLRPQSSNLPLSLYANAADVSAIGGKLELIDSLRRESASGIITGSNVLRREAPAMIRRLTLASNKADEAAALLRRQLAVGADTAPVPASAPQYGAPEWPPPRPMKIAGRWPLIR